MSHMSKRDAIAASLALAFLIGLACAFMQVGQAPGVSGGTTGSGTVSANGGTAGAAAIYAAASGSTTVGASADVFDGANGTLTVGATGVGNGRVTLAGSTSGTISIACNANACTQFSIASPVNFTGSAIALTGHLNQAASGDFANSCTQSSGSCTWSLNAAFTGTPLCMPFMVSGTITGILNVTVSSTTVTIHDSVTSDTGVTGAICVGNPS